MPDCDPEGRIFLSALTPMIYSFFLHTFHYRKWVFDNAGTSIADVRHIVTFSDVITFSDVNVNVDVPWRPVQSLYIKHVKIFILSFPLGG